MNNAVFLPGFAQAKSMYSRLEVFNDSGGIDIIPNTSWDETIRSISKKVELNSVVVGYSMGARLALGLALDHPEKVKALILISLNAGLSDDKSKKDRLVADEKLANEVSVDFDAAFSKFDANPIFDNNGQSNSFAEDRLKDKDLIVDQLKILGLGNMPNYEERLIELRAPVLYISGSRDKKYIELNARYKKKTPFSHHKILDSDHRVVQSNPFGVSLNIEWFSNNFV